MPVWFEPVSVPKSTRATSLLSLLTYVSPNEHELAAMAAATRLQRHFQQEQQHCNGGASCCCNDSCMLHGQRHTEQQQEDVPATLQKLAPDIATLLVAGVQHVVLTLGAQGAALCTLEARQQLIAGAGLDDIGACVSLPQSDLIYQAMLSPLLDCSAVCHVPALPATMVNSSGAGDCLVAGCLFALAQGLHADAVLAHGVATARAAVESQRNVPASLHAGTVRSDAAAALACSRRFYLPMGCQRCSAVQNS